MNENDINQNELIMELRLSNARSNTMIELLVSKIDHLANGLDHVNQKMADLINIIAVAEERHSSTKEVIYRHDSDLNNLRNQVIVLKDQILALSASAPHKRRDKTSSIIGWREVGVAISGGVIIILSYLGFKA